mgnify:FL=1|jgi:hypothetical protein
MGKIRNLFLLSVLLLSLPLWAQTEDDAKKAAMKFLQGKMSITDVKLTSVVVGESANLAKSVNGIKSTSSSESGLYAFNIDGGGFALVCTGNGNTAVAGYSDTGEIDADNMPDAMKNWLKGYQKAMAASCNLETKEPGWVGPTVKPVAPLLKTKWGQSAPFNCKCPSNGKQTAVAGCVPVALAQILNYYHQDRKGEGSLYYSHLDSETEYDVDYSTTTYDWKNMLNEYDANASKVQKDAVGKLMLECGIASKAKYGYSETGATIPFVALNKYYNYECMFIPREYTYSRKYISTKKWMTLIQDELEAGRPIIYSATDVEGGVDDIIVDPATSHCFILDGIDEQNYVHVNWGWAGSMDGYYDVAILNPGLSFNYQQGFRCQHEMIIGIQPRKTDYKEEVYQTFIPYDRTTSRGDAVESKPSNGFSTLAASVSSSISGPSVKSYTPSVITSKSYMYFHLTRNSYESKQTNFTTVLTKDGKIVKILPGGYYNQSVSGFPSINRWNLKQGFSKVPVGLADGVYDIRVAYKDDSGNTLLCPFPKQLIPTMEIVNNGAGMILKGLEGEDLDKKLVIQDIKPASEIFAGTTFYLYLTGKGSSMKSSLLFRNVETNKVYGSYSGANSRNSFSFYHIYDDYTSTQIEKFVPKNVNNGFSMPAGRYKIELPENETSVSLAKDFYIDVQEKPNYPILDGSDLAYLKYTYKNVTDEVNNRGYNLVPNYTYLTSVGFSYNYANKNTDPVDLKLYLVNQDTKEEKLLDVIKDWVYGENIYLNRSLFPLEGNYEFRVRYKTPDGDRTGLMPAEYYGRKAYHNYCFTYDEKELGQYCQMVSAEVVGNVGRSSETQLKLGLKTFEGYSAVNAVVKGLFFDMDKEEVIVDSVTKIRLDDGVVTNVMLSPKLTSNTKYQVVLLYNNYDVNKGIYDNLLYPDKTAVEFTLKDKTITGISNVSVSANGFFQDGELVSVYDLQGRKIKKVAASTNIWAGLMSSLPSGTYILKSASKSIKFKN